MKRGRGWRRGQNRYKIYLFWWPSSESGRMRLTAYSDYALRVLMYLALKGEGRATIKEISDCYGISRNHLMKIVQDLGRAGLIATVRGKSGGIALARAPEAIRVGDVVRLTEPDFRLVECFGGGPGRCRLQGCCILTTALSEALEAFLEVLDGYTLADLTGPRRTLRRLLDLGALPSTAAPRQGVAPA